jgi:hypothetical protein
VQQQSHIPMQSTYITPIACPFCGGKAVLARRTPSPDGSGSEIRTFECVDCGKQSELQTE